MRQSGDECIVCGFGIILPSLRCDHCDSEANVPGRVHSRITEVCQGHAAEIEYMDDDENLIGKWAYGSFDPNLPYQGEEREQ